MKFERAKFFDPKQERWRRITLEEYQDASGKADLPANVGELLECPSAHCHGALSFTKAYSRNGHNNPVAAHFSSNGKGEPHTPSCKHEPAPENRQQIRMYEALERGYAILFNLNFSTSYNREKAKLPTRIARSAMPKLNGSLRSEWIRTNRNDYARFSAHSLEKINSDLRALQNAAEQHGLGFHSALNAVFVSHLHGVVPWSSFEMHSPEMPNHTLMASRRHIQATDIFEILYKDMLGKTRANRFWNPSAVFASGIRAIPVRGRDNCSLLTHVRDYIEIDGDEFPLQNVVRSSDEQVVSSLRCGAAFSLVAMPYIERQQVERVLRNGEGYIHLNWPVNDRNQFGFE